MVAVLENFVFRHRILILVILGAITAVMGYYASQLRMDAGFAKQLPRAAKGLHGAGRISGGTFFRMIEVSAKAAEVGRLPLATTPAGWATLGGTIVVDVAIHGQQTLNDHGVVLGPTSMTSWAP